MLLPREEWKPSLLHQGFLECEEESIFFFYSSTNDLEDNK